MMAVLRMITAICKKNFVLSSSVVGTIFISSSETVTYIFNSRLQIRCWKPIISLSILVLLLYTNLDCSPFGKLRSLFEWDRLTSLIGWWNKTSNVCIRIFQYNIIEKFIWNFQYSVMHVCTQKIDIDIFIFNIYQESMVKYKRNWMRRFPSISFKYHNGGFSKQSHNEKRWNRYQLETNPSSSGIPYLATTD